MSGLLTGVLDPSSRSSPIWRARDRSLTLDRPRVMGILNVTPDSFSDGGELSTVAAAVQRGRDMIDAGADLLDIGGESTRPGTVSVDAGEERRRVVPVIEALVRELPHVLLSVDTVKSEVAAAALDAGAHVVNDVSGGRLDPAILDVCVARRAGVVLMHSRGTVADMASFTHARYDDVVADVCAELRECVDAARAAGVDADCIVLDPGIGFAKRGEHSIAVLAGLDRVTSLGFPVMVGASRKRVIGEITGRTAPAERLAGTIGAHVTALIRGARIFRVHDVREHRDALDVAWAILRAGAGV